MKETKTPASSIPVVLAKNKGGVALAPPVQAISAAAQPAIQAKLLVSHPNDPLEHEADRAADRVVSLWQGGGFSSAPAGDGPPAKPITPIIQRRASSPAAGSVEASPQVAQQIQAAQGSGQALSGELLPPLEATFGMDFSGVRLHTDHRADTLNRDLQARAFTTGQDIFFRQGEYRPGTTEGVRLLGHELGHVGQQGGGAIVQRDVVSREFVEERYRILQIRLATGQARHAAREEEERGNATDRMLSGIANTFGGTRLPEYRIWHNAINLLRRARASIQANSFDQANRILDETQASLERAYRHLNLHMDSTIRGASRAESTAEGIRNASAIGVTILAPATAPIIAEAILAEGTAVATTELVVAGLTSGLPALNNAVQATASQVTSTHLGLQQRVDWAGITFDFVFSTALGFLLERYISTPVFETVLRRVRQVFPAIQVRFLREAVANAISNLVLGRFTAVTSRAFRIAFDNVMALYRNDRPYMTGEQFMNQMMRELSAQQALIDLLVGASSRYIQDRRSAAPAHQTEVPTVPTQGSTTTEAPAAPPTALEAQASSLGVTPEQLQGIHDAYTGGSGAY